MAAPGLKSHAANAHMPYAVTPPPNGHNSKLQKQSQNIVLKIRFLGKEWQYDM